VRRWPYLRALYEAPLGRRFRLRGSPAVRGPRTVPGRPGDPQEALPRRFREFPRCHAPDNSRCWLWPGRPLRVRLPSGLPAVSHVVELARRELCGGAGPP
jgi:hypothetical protein